MAFCDDCEELDHNEADTEGDDDEGSDNEHEGGVDDDSDENSDDNSNSDDNNGESEQEQESTQSSEQEHEESESTHETEGASSAAEEFATGGMPGWLAPSEGHDDQASATSQQPPSEADSPEASAQGAATTASAVAGPSTTAADSPSVLDSISSGLGSVFGGLGDALASAVGAVDSLSDAANAAFGAPSSALSQGDQNALGAMNSAFGQFQAHSTAFGSGGGIAALSAVQDFQQDISGNDPVSPADAGAISDEQHDRIVAQEAQLNAQEDAANAAGLRVLAELDAGEPLEEDLGGVPTQDTTLFDATPPPEFDDLNLNPSWSTDPNAGLGAPGGTTGLEYVSGAELDGSLDTSLLTKQPTSVGGISLQSITNQVTGLSLDVLDTGRGDFPTLDSLESAGPSNLIADGSQTRSSVTYGVYNATNEQFDVIPAGVDPSTVPGAVPLDEAHGARFTNVDLGDVYNPTPGSGVVGIWVKTADDDGLVPPTPAAIAPAPAPAQPPVWSWTFLSRYAADPKDPYDTALPAVVDRTDPMFTGTDSKDAGQTGSADDGVIRGDGAGAGQGGQGAGAGDSAGGSGAGGGDSGGGSPGSADGQGEGASADSPFFHWDYVPREPLRYYDDGSPTIGTLPSGYDYDYAHAMTEHEKRGMGFDAQFFQAAQQLALAHAALGLGGVPGEGFGDPFAGAGRGVGGLDPAAAAIDGLGAAAGLNVGEIGSIDDLLTQAREPRSPGEITIYRVEGAPNTRVLIDDSGNVTLVQDGKVTWLNFDQLDRAVDYYEQKVAAGLPDAAIKVFETDPGFLEELQSEAVPEKRVRASPDAPILSRDTTQGGVPDQYGLRQPQLSDLQGRIRPASGRVYR